MLKLLPGASTIVITEPFVVGRESLTVDALADAVTAIGFPDRYMSNRIPVRRCVLPRLSPGMRRAVLATGSMYLAGQVRRRWIRDQDVVLQRTPWPTANAESRLGTPGPLGGLVRDKADRECHEAADHQVPAPS